MIEYLVVNVRKAGTSTRPTVRVLSVECGGGMEYVKPGIAWDLNVLNAIGALGWQLCGVDDGMYIFSRSVGGER